MNCCKRIRKSPENQIDKALVNEATEEKVNATEIKVKDATEIKVEHNNETKEDENNDKTICFHLVRHGETDYNKEGKVQGHMDIPLNENGLNQAKELGLCLAEYLNSAKAVIASPVLRAKQTGEAIHKQMNENAKVELKVMDAFAELHYGDLVGMLLKDCSDIVVDLKENKWAKGEFDESFPGKDGESLNSIIARMTQGFLELAAEYEDGTDLIIATHSQCIEAFLVHLKAFSYLDQEIRAKNKNCTVSKIELNVTNQTFIVQSVFDDLTVHVNKIVTLNLG